MAKWTTISNDCSDSGDFTGFGTYGSLTGGEIVFLIPTGVSSYSAYFEATSIGYQDLSDSEVSVELMDFDVDGRTDAECYLTISDIDSNRVYFLLGYGDLQAYKTTGGPGSPVDAAVGSPDTFNATTMKFLWFREASGTSYWEYSATRGGARTILHSEASTFFDPSSCWLGGGSGCWGTQSGNFRTAWDNINLPALGAEYIATGTGDTTTGNTSLTPAYPATVLADDYALLTIAKQAAHTVGTITDANGSWTSVASLDELAVYERTDCDGNEDSDTVTVALSGGDADDEAYAQISTYRHPDGAISRNATTTTATGTGTAVTTGTLTPGDDDALIVHVIGASVVDGAAPTFSSWTATDPATLTERTDQASS